MSQHDYDIANQAGAAFRADLNLLFAAIVSQNSGATEPATKFAYQFWADTTTGILKQRNAANTAWVSIWNMATGALIGNAATATNQSGGTVAATTGSFSGLISADGGQIKFPTTQNASADPNTLDDYEEGTWTPTLGGTSTYAVQEGTYIKIGKKVYCSFEISVSSLGSGSTNTISGLPFTSKNAIGSYVGHGNVIHWWGLSTAAINLWLVIAKNGTTAQLFGMTAAGTQSNIVSFIQTSTLLFGTIEYEAAN